MVKHLNMLKSAATKRKEQSRTRCGVLRNLWSVLPKTQVVVTETARKAQGAVVGTIIAQGIDFQECIGGWNRTHSAVRFRKAAYKMGYSVIHAFPPSRMIGNNPKHQVDSWNKRIKVGITEIGYGPYPGAIKDIPY